MPSHCHLSAMPTHQTCTPTGHLSEASVRQIVKIKRDAGHSGLLFTSVSELRNSNSDLLLPEPAQILKGEIFTVCHVKKSHT